MMPQRAFAVSPLVFGTILVLLVPPFQVPDEPSYFFRAYQISAGRLVPTWEDNVGRGALPASIIQVFQPFSAVRNNKATTLIRAVLDDLKIPLRGDVHAAPGYGHLCGVGLCISSVAV
jgi:hypothetical protein